MAHHRTDVGAHTAIHIATVVPRRMDVIMGVHRRMEARGVAINQIRAMATAMTATISVVLRHR